MQVNEILSRAASFLGLGDVTIQENSTDDRVSKLVNALGVAYVQLVTEYVHLEKEETVSIENGEKALSELSENFFDAVQLKDESGLSVRFRVRGGKLFAEDGTYRLRYYYAPSSFPEIGEEIEVPLLVSAELFARGVAAEYALENMMYEEASLFEKRYKDGLLNVLAPHKKASVRFGRWI